ncbi:MAG: RNA polymerase sigma factor [Saprospiraceae bacterium]|nr:RNA polymerase sigma factor [Saprospiraceae bacterium]
MIHNISNIEEHNLIKGCVNNDRKYQEVLYKKYFQSMYQMCLRYSKDDYTICAILNDAFLTVFKNIHKFESRGSLEGWIRRITFNTLADHFRKENRQMRFLLIDDHSEKIPSYEPELHDYDDIILKINTLKGSFKEVFVKYAIEGYNHKEIGECLSISEGTSKWYLSEARKKLQAMFNLNNSTYQYGK